MRVTRLALALAALCVFVAPAVAKDTARNKTIANTPSTASADFDRLKSLSGEWISRSVDDPMLVVRHNYRVIANGSAVQLTTDVPNEGAMVTIFHMDGDRLMATHYCGAKNQPRYVQVTSPERNALVFKFKDATNLLSPQTGHMSALTLQFEDSDHHSQNWTWTENGKTKLQRFSLERAN